MTFAELQNTVLGIRFVESQRAFAKGWINSRYRLIWDSEDWRFKCRVATLVHLASNNQILTDAPAALGAVRELWYAQDGASMGVQLSPLSPPDFAQLYQGSSELGEPRHYTVTPHSLTAGQEVRVGPTPASAYALTLFYDRSLCHIEGGIVTPGVMVEDTDEPVFPEEYHDILVPAAMSLGLKLEQDPGWQDVHDEFLTQLQAMRDELLPDDAGAGLQYRRELL